MPQALDASTLIRMQERALRVLLPGAIHALNNSLTLVATHAHLLAADVGTPAVAWCHEQAQSLVRATRRAQRCLDLLAELTREPEPSERAEPWDLGALLEDLAETMVCERGGVRVGLGVRCLGPLMTQLPAAAVTALVLVAIDTVVGCTAAAPAGTVAVEAAATGPRGLCLAISLLGGNSSPAHQAAVEADAELVSLVSALGGGIGPSPPRGLSITFDAG